MKKMLVLITIIGLLSPLNMEASVDLYILNISKNIPTSIAAFLMPRSTVSAPEGWPSWNQGPLKYGCFDIAHVPDDFITEVYSYQTSACSTTYRVAPFDMSTLTPGTKPTTDNMTKLTSEAGKDAPFNLRIWTDAITQTGDLFDVHMANESLGEPTKNPLGTSSDFPIIFPGMWNPFPSITTQAYQDALAKSDITTLRNEVVMDAINKKNLKMAIDFYLRPVKIFYEKPYIFMSDFQGPMLSGKPVPIPPMDSLIQSLSADSFYPLFQKTLSGYSFGDIADKYYNVKGGRNLSNYAQDPLMPANYTDIATLTQQAKDQQSSATNAPAILQSGSFGTIINKLTPSYQIKDKSLSEIVGGGSATNAKTLWGSANTTFNTLWNDSKAIIFEPKDDQTFPTFTFTFDETYSTITIARGSVAAQTGTSWSINFTPLITALSALPLPLPKQWSLDFTIDENWNIIVNALNLECHTFAVVSNAIQETVHNFVLSARSVTYSTSVNGVVTSQAVPASLSGGLCGLSILLSNNPTCAVSK